jgi:hypothetical protein
MYFSNYNYLNYFRSIFLEAEDYIKNNNFKSFKELVDKYDVLGTASVYLNFGEMEPLFYTAIKNARDDMALSLYLANPIDIKNYIHKIAYKEFTIYTDILGCAVFHSRYELVKELLDLKGNYELDIDGVKNTGNILLNHYYIINHGDSNNIRFDLDEGAAKYISSPLLISILLGDWDMYLLLKNKGAYFNKENKDCKFHLEYCNNIKILKDIEHSFN